MKAMPLIALCILSYALLGAYAQAQGNSCNNSCDNSCNVSCFSCCDTSCSSSCNSNEAHCKTEFLPFSQSENRARDYAGVAHFQYLPDEDYSYWHAGLAVEYNENLKRHKLGSYFFPNTNTLTVGPNGGTGVDVRNVDIGLSDTFLGTLTIEPRIQNLIIEPAAYVGLDHWLAGAYVWIKFPITHTRWQLDCCETDSFLGGTFFGQFSEMQNGAFTQVPTTGINQIQQAFSGTTTWGNKTIPLQQCRISCCRQSKNGIADIPFHMGWTFLSSNLGYLGIYFRGVVPTGKVHGEMHHTLFAPRVGYDRWQAGAGFNAALKFDVYKETSVNLFMDLFVTHIFSKTECRCVDLTANGCLSRYLLMKQADQNGLYTGTLATFVDVFSVCAKSKFNWNLDGLIFLNFKHKSCGFDVGYEIKARDREKFDCECPFKLCDPTKEDPCDECCLNEPNSIGTKQYGIKGTSLVEAPGTLISTQSTSTMSTAGPTDPTPVFINATNFDSQINLGSTAVPRALSNKFWFNINYSWEEYSAPIFACLGTEVEWGNGNKAETLWGVWAKTGVAYN